jgi:RpiB/LacA/LacB family sugar-phosphate isomerase
MVESMRIALGSDHAGFDLKAVLATTLAEWGHVTLDLGTNNATESVDYPDFGAAVGRSVASGECDLGVAVCGSGIGISIAANKVPGVRAAVVHDVTSAHLAREHPLPGISSHRFHRRSGGPRGLVERDAREGSPRRENRQTRRARRKVRRR